VIALDHARLFKAADAAEARRCGQADSLRQLDVGHAPVGLQFAQDREVDFVEFYECHRQLSHRKRLNVII
jgi:hypothetical protein